MFEYEVVDVLPIGDRCIVFTGKIGKGQVHVGDELRLKSPKGEVGVIVMSLEPRGFRLAGALAGDNVAIVVEPFCLDDIADGFVHVEGITYQVSALTLHG
ncbi:hypothetical protein [Pseudoduganella violaceinigra]|uniref:hypothetical protein n=1 Tax=Pseudoduganella violaceinigra TaxID=246602 RepID=UPI0004867193|nr:hypothetical protein [Pseudoduganella violaceinigra]